MEVITILTCMYFSEKCAVFTERLVLPEQYRGLMESFIT